MRDVLFTFTTESPKAGGESLAKVQEGLLRFSSSSIQYKNVFCRMNSTSVKSTFNGFTILFSPLFTSGVIH